MTPETVCPTCGGRGHLYPDAPRGKTVPACPQCHGTGRIPAQRSGTTRQLPKGLACPICGYRAMDTHGHKGSETPKTPAEAEVSSTPFRRSITSIPPTPAGEGELDRLIASKEWLYDCTAYGEGQQCCVEAGHPNRARLDAYIARRVLEVIGEDESEIEDPLADPTEQAYNYNHEAIARNELRAQQRQRIAVIKKESQQ